MVLWASALISKARRILSLSPGFILAFRDRKRERYSRRISFFSCSSLRLYFGICSTVSIVYEFTKNRPLPLPEMAYICNPFEYLDRLGSVSGGSNTYK